MTEVLTAKRKPRNMSRVQFQAWHEHYCRRCVADEVTKLFARYGRGLVTECVLGHMPWRQQIADQPPPLRDRGGADI